MVTGLITTSSLIPFFVVKFCATDLGFFSASERGDYFGVLALLIVKMIGRGQATGDQSELRNTGCLH